MGTRYFDEGRQALERLGFDPGDEDDVLRALAEPIRKIPRDELQKMDLAAAIVLSLSAGHKHFFAVEVLGQIGTEKSVAALKNCLSSKNQDIRSSAVAALARILPEEGREICIQALKNSSFKNKAHILRAIRNHDDGQAVPSVMQRMKRIIPRGRDNDRDSDGLTEINLALDYLRRIDAGELRELQALVWEHWDKLGASTCSWIAQNMPEIMPGPETPMLSTDEFLTKIEKLKFFDGFTPQAARKAKALIRKNHKQGLAGSGAKYYRRFPGFALIFLSIDGEWDGEPYEPLVREFAKASFGMFAPKKIKDVRSGDAAMRRRSRSRWRGRPTKRPPRTREDGFLPSFWS